MTTFVEQFNATYRKPHPFRQRLKELGFRQVAVAGFLGIHTSYLCNLLAGMHKMPQHIEQALQELISLAQEEEQRAA